MSDHMLDAEQAIARLTADNIRLATERDNWQQRAEVVEQAMQRMALEIHSLPDERDSAIKERDAAQEERDAAEQKHKEAAEWNSRLAIHLNDMRAERDAARAERDVAEREWTECRAQVSQLRREYDAERAEVEATREERDAAREERDAARAEAEGLRADLLAHPPEVHQELAIERKRHVELMEDYDRREVVITTLEEALKRTENTLKTAQTKHIDPRIPGYAATIVQLASQIEDLLP